MKNILLLHGALGAKSQFDELNELLNEVFKVNKINFSGHGGLEIPDVPFSIELFANDVIRYLDAHEIMSVDIFGYSMGGYVGTYLASHFKKRVGKVFALGTKFKWNEIIAEREVKMLDARRMKQKIPQFYEELKKRHSPQNLETILKKTAEMMQNLGKLNELNENDFEIIESEITVAVGDRDNMVSLDESIEVFKKMPKGKLLVLPGTSHSFEQMNNQRIVFEIQSFFSK